MKKIYLFITLVLVMMMTACGTKTTEQPAAQGSDNPTVETEASQDEEAAASEATEMQDTDQPSQPESATATSYPLTLTDKFGKTVNISEKPNKVISFSPEDVEIMYALGVGNLLVGRSTYCDYPEAVLSVADMGDLFNFNVESVVAAQPDLVLLSSMADESLIQSLNEKGLTVLSLDMDATLDGTYSYISTLGRIFDVQEAAETLSSDMKTEIAAINDKVKSLDKPAMYFVVGVGEYDSGATGDTFINNMIELAGGVNIAADGTGWMYSVEQIVEKDPDMLICSMFYDTKAQIQGAEGYKDLRAVKNGSIYEVDENLFFRQGPRIVEGIRVLAEILHPDAF